MIITHGLTEQQAMEFWDKLTENLNMPKIDKDDLQSESIRRVLLRMSELLKDQAKSK